MNDLSFLLLFCLFLRSVYGRHVNSSDLISPFNHVNTLPKALSPFNVTSPFNHSNLLHAAPSPSNFPSPFHRGNLHHVASSPSNVTSHFNRGNLLHAAPSPSNITNPIPFIGEPFPFQSLGKYHRRNFNWQNNRSVQPKHFDSTKAGASPSVVSGVPLARRYNIGFYVMLGISIVLLLAIIVLLCRNKFLSNPISILKKRTGPEQSIISFINNYQSPAPMQYRYSEIKKLTNSFQEKIGQGGYGGVFKGKLTDGRLVAVKVFNNSKGNGEDFFNEVATIGRTNHVNIVSLLGYCSEGSKRALVYEFMPNGSLEKFICNEKNTSATHPLGWEKQYQIALGIANGLEYLHHGCNTRILHFDIKPHNILLDKDFCPKISDFGLSKLCATRESIVSMLNARGTIGYIAPEVYCRNFGGVSSKSDVYSYGMLLLEMVGGKKNIDTTVYNTDSDDIYFPEWIYIHLEKHGNIGLGGFNEMSAEERKMIIVGLWSIQTHPVNRPSMTTVVEMLQKSVDDLQIPPNPFQEPAT